LDERLIQVQVADLDVNLPDSQADVTSLPTGILYCPISQICHFQRRENYSLPLWQLLVFLEQFDSEIWSLSLSIKTDNRTITLPKSDSGNEM